MADNQLEAVLTLVDDFTKKMDKIRKSTEKATNTFGQASKAMDKTSVATNSLANAAQNSHGGFDTMTKGMLNALNAVNLLRMGIGAMGKAYGVIFDMVKEYNSLQKEQFRLANGVSRNITRNEGGVEAYRPVFKQMLADINEGSLGETTVSAKEMTAMMASLSPYLQTQKQINQAKGPMSNLLVQMMGINHTAKDAEVVGQKVAKMLGGQTEILSRYGVKISKATKKQMQFMDEQQKMNVIFAATESLFKDLDKTMANTNEGVLKRFANNIEAIKQVVGDDLVDSFMHIVRMLNFSTPYLLTEILKITPYINKVMDYIAFKVIPFIVSRLPAVVDMTIRIGKALWSIRTVLAAIVTLCTIVATILTGKLIAGAIAGMFTGFVAVLGPIGLVIAALASLAIAYGLTKAASDDFEASNTSTFDKLLNHIDRLGTSFQRYIVARLEAVFNLLGIIGKFAAGVLGKLADTGDPIGSIVDQTIESLKDARDIFRTLGNDDASAWSAYGDRVSKRAKQAADRAKQYKEQEEYVKKLQKEAADQRLTFNNPYVDMNNPNIGEVNIDKDFLKGIKILTEKEWINAAQLQNSVHVDITGKVDGASIEASVTGNEYDKAVAKQMLVPSAAT